MDVRVVGSAGSTLPQFFCLFLLHPVQCTQMGREVLEGLRVLPKPAVPITQENQQTDHCPSRYYFGRFDG